jgi:dCMP deaminase
MAGSLDEKRDLYYLRQAYKYAHKNSVDPSTHTGIVIVKNYQIIVRGANHGPGRLIIPDEILHSPAKYDWVEHAEQNGIHDAARKGIGLEGSTIYSPWFPCSPCASAIIGAGIIELVTHKELQDLSAKLDIKWGDSQKRAAEMLKLKGIKLREVSGRIGDDIPILFKGQIFYL